MRKILLFVLVIATIISCTSLKKELQSKERYDRLSKGFSIEKLPNWTFHGFHDIFNLTPNDLMVKGKDYIRNYVSVYKYRKPTDSPLDSIAKNHFKSMFDTEISDLKKYAAQTEYGKSVVITYKATHGNYKYACVRQYYKLKDHVYQLNYVAEQQYFDTYYDEAIAMMKTFKITE
ncbi:hypothetical protein [uncultured Kordia sp.]|uniref:hypothetical protein n=1 Tax=uncultured Kordia sp. TaxID=507699 RepID=UPI0026116802|nr:hypothetical protein [uncultured Kordia sp.]